MPKKWYRDISQCSIAEKQFSTLLSNLQNCIDLRNVKSAIRKLLDSDVSLEKIAYTIKRSIRHFLIKKYTTYRNEIDDEDSQDAYTEAALPIIKKMIKEANVQIYKLLRKTQSEVGIRKELKVLKIRDKGKLSTFQTCPPSMQSEKLPVSEPHTSAIKLPNPKNSVTSMNSEKIIGLKKAKFEEISYPPRFGSRQIEEVIPRQCWKPKSDYRISRSPDLTLYQQAWENKSNYRIPPIVLLWYNKSDYRISYQAWENKCNYRIYPKWYSKSDYRISQDQIHLSSSPWENKSNYRISPTVFYLGLRTPNF